MPAPLTRKHWAAKPRRENQRPVDDRLHAPRAWMRRSTRLRDTESEPGPHHDRLPITQATRLRTSVFPIGFVQNYTLISRDSRIDTHRSSANHSKSRPNRCDALEFEPSRYLIQIQHRCESTPFTPRCCIFQTVYFCFSFHGRVMLTVTSVPSQKLTRRHDSSSAPTRRELLMRECISKPCGLGSRCSAQKQFSAHRLCRHQSAFCSLQN